MSKKLPYPEDLARGYPPGVTPDRRKIIGCSDSSLWYMGFVGKIITVHYFATFGAWDTKGRWLWYYDLSAPIKRELTDKDIETFLKEEMQRIREAKAYMNKWDDIPLTWQLDHLCMVLKIKKDSAALNFCTGLLLQSDIDNAKILFDIRKHEYK